MAAFGRDRPKLNNLLEQVVEVFEWEQVGTALGVKKYKLSEIREARHGVTANCKLDLFDYWLRSDVRASWKKLIEALEKVEYFELARNLRAKHGLRREILHPPAVQEEEPMAQDMQQPGHSVRGQSARGPPMPGRVNETVAMQDTGAQPQSPNLASILSALSRDDSKVDDVNAVEQSGLKRSILQQTIIKQDINMAKVLIALGANVNYINEKNSTALDIAVMMNYGNAIELLKNVGGVCANDLLSTKPSSAVESDEEMRSLSGPLVLSLDSSGDKALVQLEVLNQLEQLTGRKICELFDYMVGSGIGGLMLLAMVYAGKSVRQVQRQYYQYMQQILSSSDAKKKWRKLEDFAHDLFSSKRMENVKSPKILIGAVNKESTALKLKFFTNDSQDSDASLHVYKVACYTCATPEYYDVIGRDTDHYIHGGAICRNLTPTALTFINESCNKPSILGVVSVGEGIWSSTDFSKQTDLSLTACATDALVEQVHQNCKSRFSSSSTFYYRINPIFPFQTPVRLLLHDLVDLHVTTISILVGKSSESCVEMESLACQLRF